MSSVHQTAQRLQPATSVLLDRQSEAQLQTLRRENAELSDRLFLLTQQLSEKDRALTTMARCLEEVENLLKSHLEANFKD